MNRRGSIPSKTRRLANRHDAGTKQPVIWDSTTGSLDFVENMGLKVSGFGSTQSSIR